MSEALRLLRAPETIRERCARILAAGREGRLNHFEVVDSALSGVADRVVEVTRQNYPELDIPYHSRWNHFRVGGTDRAQELRARIDDPDELARAQLDLVVTSVLLDAGAGPRWRYREESSKYARSEGLAVASFHVFMSGALSSDPQRPYRVDAAGLAAFSAQKLAVGFQVSDDNPLVGLEGRAALIRSLGEAMTRSEELFGSEGRPGGLYDALRAESVDAGSVLDAVLRGFSSIWPGRMELDGENLGDVWPHPEAGGSGTTAGLVPLHKLSQWLSYSLLEPFEWRGIEVTGVERLTGLAEYRNGGLFVDGGVLRPRRDQILSEAHQPSSEVIVEWRALTVALLDEVGALVRERLGKSETELSLAKVLEGGTWHTGRALARERRSDGSPPIRIVSDGTVF